ncbi:MAG: cyclic nucleotide-binding domain-containing protein [Ferrovibrio sp.]|uniref:cyclic nucleotide-binding domain-containing protein n=1 Tax=Ferrovibrio sp. TaxID=1917215 RepID=UPI00260C2584|nr:cyclic nucleotide-binding domain-containing protein [Ferrovibrio sp.]MCW0234799.1 cyclic nucleotide-binding domain-containing protein [Ferrovibrio sp.]
MRPSDLQLFQKTEIFARLGEATAERLARNCQVKDYPKNTMLTEQGETAEYVHLILNGRVALTAECLDGSSTIVTSFGDGEIFVTAAAILQQPYLVAAKTISPCRILLIPVTRFRQALQTEAALALLMVDRLAHHWRLLVGHLRELKLHTALERLASYLVTRSPAARGAAHFRLTEDRRTIAAELGMSAECLSRSFQQLRACGVRVSGSRVHILDVAQLKKLYRPVVPAPRHMANPADETFERSPESVHQQTH